MLSSLGAWRLAEGHLEQWSVRLVLDTLGGSPTTVLIRNLWNLAVVTDQLKEELLDLVIPPLTG